VLDKHPTMRPNAIGSDRSGVLFVGGSLTDATGKKTAWFAKLVPAK